MIFLLTFPVSQALVSVQRAQLNFCGGTLISDEWVLTSAFCVQGVAATSVQVMDPLPPLSQVGLGEHDFMDGTESKTVVAGVSVIMMNPSFNVNTMDYDFALLKMTSKIDWAANPHIRPVCMPTFDMTSWDFTGDTAFVTGKDPLLWLRPGFGMMVWSHF